MRAKDEQAEEQEGEQEGAASPQESGVMDEFLSQDQCSKGLLRCLGRVVMQECFYHSHLWDQIMIFYRLDREKT